jgi:uncharacterized membrane protein
MSLRIYQIVVLAAFFQVGTAFAPLTLNLSSLGVRRQPFSSPSLVPSSAKRAGGEYDDLFISTTNHKSYNAKAPSSSASSAILPVILTLFTSLPAEAAGATIPSAIAAYVHYVSLLIMTALIVTERITVKEGMTDEEQQLVTYADIGIGLVGIPLVVSGYYRVVEYGMGWEFYQHEPIFWLKIALVGVFGACSFFPTATIIKRSIEQRNTGLWPPMGKNLATRMKQCLNAEITALLSIPLAATLMSRGVGYNEDIPWQLEAGLAAVVFLSLGFKYIKEALTFEENQATASSAFNEE